MSTIVLQNIDKYYGNNHVLKNLNLTIEDGEFMTLLGPSGCGKTTTLRVISGLEKPQNGKLYMDGELMVNAKELYFAPPSKRMLNLVFQSYALWPHMTVFQNVAFGLSIKKVPKEEIKTRVENALRRMQILEYQDRYPSELSGGQQQRV
ncbi:MAG TPA: ABC transporter ATP-binding protein, partial [Clostridiales bacterium]|nr:ABC transporter ATP-binding protein [Clostridiales bacterium]